MHTRLSFFVGKGGVGKTTVAAAYSLHRAVSHRANSKVALLSADTTESLSELLDAELSSELEEVPVSPSRCIRAAIAKPQSLRELFGADYQQLVHTISDSALLESGDAEALLASAVPGLAEITSLFRIYELVESGEFDEVIVDGAALGHSLRLLSTPGELLALIRAADHASDRDRRLAAQFGSHVDCGRSPWIAKWQQATSRVQEMFLAAHTELFLVSTPELFSFNELTRALTHLPRQATALVINRVPRVGGCSRCKRLCANADLIAEKMLHQEPSLAMYEGRDTGESVAGIRSLSAFARELFSGVPRLAPSKPKALNLRFKQAEWPRWSSPHVASFGKGGVGKTTLSAAAAYVEAGRECKDVIVCSVDPSPSLDDVFGTPIGETAERPTELPNLYARELDPEAAYRSWSRAIQRRISQSSTVQGSRLHIDFGANVASISALLEVVPPGVDEVFAIAALAQPPTGEPCAYVIDMAPSTHSIELLRSPRRVLAWTRALMRALTKLHSLRVAQDLAVEVAELSQHVRAAEQILNRDCSPYLVAAAEETSYSQMLSLRSDLSVISTRQPRLFLNRVLTKATPCLRCSVARSGQQVLIKRACIDFPGFYVLPEFGREIIGEANLARLGRTILEVA